MTQLQSSSAIQAIAHRLSQTTGAQARLLVLEDDRPLAYSFSPDTIILSRGLIDRYGQSQIAAAMAHEFGHLLDDGHMHLQQALTGLWPEANTAEHRADQWGMQLLARAGYDRSDMARLLLQMSCDPSLSSSTRQAIAVRLAACQPTP